MSINIVEIVRISGVSGSQDGYKTASHRLTKLGTMEH